MSDGNLWRLARRTRMLAAHRERERRDVAARSARRCARLMQPSTMSHSIRRAGSFVLPSTLACLAALLALPSCSEKIGTGSAAANLTFSMTDGGADRFSSFVVDVTKLEASSVSGDFVTVFSGIQ